MQKKIITNMLVCCTVLSLVVPMQASTRYKNKDNTKLIVGGVVILALGGGYLVRKGFQWNKKRVAGNEYDTLVSSAQTILDRGRKRQGDYAAMLQEPPKIAHNLQPGAEGYDGASQTDDVESRLSNVVSYVNGRQDVDITDTEDIGRAQRHVDGFFDVLNGDIASYDAQHSKLVDYTTRSDETNRIKNVEDLISKFTASRTVAQQVQAKLQTHKGYFYAIPIKAALQSFVNQHPYEEDVSGETSDDAVHTFVIKQTKPNESSPHLMYASTVAKKHGQASRLRGSLERHQAVYNLLPYTDLDNTLKCLDGRVCELMRNFTDNRVRVQKSVFWTQEEKEQAARQEVQRHNHTVENEHKLTREAAESKAQAEWQKTREAERLANEAQRTRELKEREIETLKAKTHQLEVQNGIAADRLKQEDRITRYNHYCERMRARGKMPKPQAQVTASNGGDLHDLVGILYPDEN